ncbi:GNAT family N-acetyltransferase [Paenibacillus vulneris]|uniref:GNAT family N-acetyltransferase n=1 Tax=Paenibacillus vulneris TaxID=1133364 RepID=A0ABW3UY26_9BACL
MSKTEHQSLIASLERLAVHTWPALTAHPYADWLVRVSEGTTKRANSVWTSTFGTIPNNPAWLEEVRNFYIQQDLPLIIQISEASPDGLDSLLEGLSFVKEGESTVMIADIEQMMELTSPAKELPLQYTVQDEHNRIWLTDFLEAEDYGAHTYAFYNRVLAGIQSPKGFVSMHRDQRTAALGTSVIQGDWAALLNVVVHPSMRRQGLGRSLLHQLACWSLDQGAVRMYLQVVESNTAAVRLYQSAGFRPLYKYHYRREILA